MASRLADVEQTLDLPPGYTLVALRELGDAFAHGCEIAASSGAGTLVWVRRYDLVEFAVVLEPDEPLTSARRAFFAGMNARGRRDSGPLPAGAGGQFRLARRDHVRRRIAGRRRGSAGPAIAPRIEVPAWLVFGAILRAADMAHIEEVQAASGVAMLSEGFEMIDTDAIIESFARHLMTGFDRWRRTRVRADRTGLSGAACRRQAGERRAIDVNGDLLVRAAAGSGPPDRTSLLDALARAAWYDRQARGPKFG